MKNNSKDNAGVITIPPVIYLAGLLTGYLIHYFYPLGFMSEPVSFLIGVLLIAVAIPIALIALLAMKRAETSPDVFSPTTEIVTTGIYRFTRNPMYTSLVIIYLGISFLVNSLWILLLLVPVVIVVNQGIIKREEKYLEQKFGEKYLQYKSEVRRWV